MGPQFVTVWENSNRAKRQYRSAELEFAFQGARFNVMGNITWSRLEGNHQGETLLGPTGSGLGNFSVVNGVQMYDPATLHPYGRLQGDIPLRIRLAGDA